MRFIYLSPHLDDAALCAGGLIYDQYQAGESVEIWTVMAGIPTTDQLTPYARVHARTLGDDQCGADGTPAPVGRSSAQPISSAQPPSTWISWMRSIALPRRARRCMTIRWARPCTPRTRPSSRKSPRSCRRRLSADDELVCLLGIGDHADHVIVRRAAEATGAPLTYVADFPVRGRIPGDDREDAWAICSLRCAPSRSPALGHGPAPCRPTPRSLQLCLETADPAAAHPQVLGAAAGNQALGATSASVGPSPRPYGLVRSIHKSSGNEGVGVLPTASFPVLFPFPRARGRGEGRG